MGSNPHSQNWWSFPQYFWLNLFFLICYWDKTPSFWVLLRVKLNSILKFFRAESVHSRLPVEWVSESRSVVSDSLWPHGPWSSPGQNTGVGSLSLLQGIFPTQESNPGLPHCRWILYQLSHKGSRLPVRNRYSYLVGLTSSFEK